MNRHETNSVTSADNTPQRWRSSAEQAPADLHPVKPAARAPSWQPAFPGLPLSHLPTEGKEETL